MSRNPERRDTARHLRREMTPAEAILWKHLRGRRFAGFKFRRQHPVGPFFADQACHQCKLIVELDGESHLDQRERDEERSIYLHQHGWLVIRFWNTQVYDELEAVLESIYRHCVTRAAPTPSPPTPLPLSTGGEGSKWPQRRGGDR